MNIKRFGFGYFLDEDEIVINVFRKPLLTTFLKIILHASLWGGLAYGAWYSLPAQTKFIWIVFACIGGYKVFALYSKWYINAIIMTNTGLVFVEWPSLFQKQSNRIDFFDLDQVGVLKLGFKSYLGNYGTLQFFQAGGNLFEVKNVNRPNRIARLIEKQKETITNEKNFTEESALKDLLSQLVLTHVKKNGHPHQAPPLSTDHSAPHPIHTKVQNIEIEKELDDSGGIEIDFEADHKN